MKTFVSDQYLTVIYLLFVILGGHQIVQSFIVNRILLVWSSLSDIQGPISEISESLSGDLIDILLRHWRALLLPCFPCKGEIGRIQGMQIGGFTLS